MRFPERCAVCWHPLPTGDVECVDPCRSITRCGGCGEWVIASTTNPRDVPDVDHREAS